MDNKQITAAVNEIVSLYQQFGSEDYIGEPVSQIEHMCQCAQLAEAAGASTEVILAALFHDIGHLCEFAFPEKNVKHMDDFGVIDHEKLGASYLLEKGFSPTIATIVESHVSAKRYLTYANPAYFNCLSEASKKTLEFQGGIMFPEEAAAFEADEHFNTFIAIRKWDDAAKQTNLPLPDMDRYKKLMIEHLTTAQQKQTI